MCAVSERGQPEETRCGACVREGALCTGMRAVKHACMWALGETRDLKFQQQ